MDIRMSNMDQQRPRPSVLRFTRTMSAPLRQTYPVNDNEQEDEFTRLLEEADRRLGANQTPQAD
jgi:hypothetical protein